VDLGGSQPLHGQTALSNVLGIFLQVSFTKMLAEYFHYLLANLTSNAVAGIFNYLLNDAWTFGLRRRKSDQDTRRISR